MGAHPAPLNSDVWEDSDLQALVSGCWAAGKPVAVFSSAAALLPRCRDEGSGEPLLRGVGLLTGLSGVLEWCQAALLAAFNCRWRPLGRLACAARRGPKRDGGRAMPPPITVEETVASAGGLRARFLPGPNPLSLESLATWAVTGETPALAAPDPFSDAGSFVVEDGPLLTAQGGKDAFLLARRFIAKLESASTVF